MEKSLLFQTFGVFISLLLLISPLSSEANNFALADDHDLLATGMSGCWAPPDTIIDCLGLTFDPSDLSSVRAALGSVEELYRAGRLQVDVSGNFSLKEEIDWKPGNCAEGTLIRTFIVNVSTTHGTKIVECSQTIRIKNKT